MSALAWLTLWGMYAVAIGLTLAYLAYGDNVRGFVPLAPSPARKHRAASERSERPQMRAEALK